MTTESGNTWPDSWLTLDHGVRTGRYTDPEFARLEHEKLWKKVWQVAARLDEIPEPGDRTVYEIGEQSVIVLRVDADTIKVFNNACPHRGTALADGPGCFEHDRIICPFHGWRWNLNGEVQFVLERDNFRNGELRDSDVALKDINFEIYAGFVFINFDKTPQPFDEFIEPVRKLIDGLAVGEMHHYWWKSVVAPANWKVAVEAFLEGYHVPATHPQLEVKSADFIYGDDVTREVNFSHANHGYETWNNGHGRFYGGPNTPMAGKVNLEGDPVDLMADRLELLVTGMDAMVLKEDVALVRSLKGKPIPEGSSLGGEYIKALYSTAAAEKRPMPDLDPDILAMWGGEIFIFPNLMILPQAGNVMMYRVRPNGFDPDTCVFEIFSTKTYPADQPVPKAQVQAMDDPGDPEQFLQIPRQDFENLPRMQKGLHTMGLKQIWFASYYEKIIMNMHREMDRYLHAEG